MTQSISITDDILSAYLDGELTQSERKRVEEALAQSETLRREFRELQHVHAAVSSLPKLSLPVDFSTGVLREIDRRAAAPTVTVQPKSNRQTAVRGRRNVAIVAGLTACLAVVATFMMNRGPQQNAGPEVALGNALNVNTDRPEGGGSLSSAGPSIGTNSNTSVANANPPSPSSIRPETLSVAVGTKDHKALVGQIVDAYEPNGVAVVKVYVVDYDETWQRLHVVLEKNSFVDTNDRSGKGDGVRADGELVAVLTGSPTDRLEQALAALAKDSGVVGLELESEPLLVAQLDEKFRAGFAVASADIGDGPVTRSTIRLPGRDPAGDDPGVARSSSTPAPLPPPSATSSANAVAEAIRKGAAWSKTVVIPATALENRSVANPAARKTDASTERSASEPVQVLFVLEKAR